MLMLMANVTVWNDNKSQSRQYLVFGGGIDRDTNKQYKDLYVGYIDNGNFSIKKSNVHLSVGKETADTWSNAIINRHSYFMAGVDDTVVIVGNSSPDADNMSTKGIDVYKVTFDGELIDQNERIVSNISFGAPYLSDMFCVDESNTSIYYSLSNIIYEISNIISGNITRTSHESSNATGGLLLTHGSYIYCVTISSIKYALTTSFTWESKSFTTGFSQQPAIGVYNDGNKDYVLMFGKRLNVFDTTTQTLTE